MASRKRRKKQAVRGSRNRGVLPAVLVAVLLITAAVAALVLFNTPERRLQRALSAGEKHLEEGEYTEAAADYKKALTIDERNVQAYTGLVKAAGESGDEQTVYDTWVRARNELAPGTDAQDGDGTAGAGPETVRAEAAVWLRKIGEVYFAGADYDNTRRIAQLLREIDEQGAEALTDKVVEVTAPPVGSTVSFGTAAGVTLNWTVLERRGSTVLLSAQASVDTRPFTETRIGVSWGYSTLRSWLNREFLSESFTAEEQARIVQVAVENPANPYDAASKNRSATEDRVFLLSVQEIEQYYPAENSRAIGMVYWTRSSARRSDTAAMCVTESGAFSTEDVRDKACGVRPALWMKLE